jgi:hypothetical protein
VRCVSSVERSGVVAIPRKGYWETATSGLSWG